MIDAAIGIGLAAVCIGLWAWHKHQQNRKQQAFLMEMMDFYRQKYEEETDE